MKIYTSYFGKKKELEKNGITIVNIALYPPRWFRCSSIKEVAPSYSILKNTKDDEEYTQRYKAEILSKVSPEQLLNTIASLSNGHDIALCCYEKPNEFCHRHLIADFLNANGADIKEYEDALQSEPTLF